MGFENIWCFALFLPLLMFWWYFGRKQKAYFLLGFLIVAILILVKPYFLTNQSGCHVVMVVDCSLSVSAVGIKKIQDQVKRALDLESEKNRLSIVTFGRNVAVEKMMQENYYFEAFKRYIDVESSHLNDALAMACSLIRLDESGKVLLMTDGLYHGSTPFKAASEAFARGVVIDTISLSDEWSKDVSVGDFHLPNRVNTNQIFQFSVELISNYQTPVSYVLKRNDVIIKKGVVELTGGTFQLPVIDRVQEAGVAAYTLMVEANGDVINVNDIGKGVVGVEGDKGILVVNSTGKSDNFTRALSGVGHKVTVMGNQKKIIDLNLLFGYKLLVLENVPASSFDEKELKSMRIFVEDQGMSLLMTGGRASFGMGGYFNSELEDILPIDMTPKEDIKQLSTSLSVVLDRSGSMGMVTSSGKTKMDLADMGTVSAMELLNAKDEISVIAVDSDPHIIVPIQVLGNDAAALRPKILSIESTGGGIYTYTGLVAGAMELNKSHSAVRHMILFADSNDAEEPGEYIDLCHKLVASGVTVSVIALGTEKDSDADFLKDVAHKGNGNIYFTEDEASLPRLFTQDVINIARPSFSEEKVELNVLPQLNSLGSFSFKTIPSVGGFNFNYNKDGAINCIMAETEYVNPMLSYMKVGAGKTMAIGFEVDGPFTGDFYKWSQYDNFFGNIVKAIMPVQESSVGVLEANRMGEQVELSFYFDPQSLTLDFKPLVKILTMDKSNAEKNVALKPSGPGVLKGSYRLDSSKVHHHVLQVKDQAVVGNAVQLPYSPEYEMKNPLRSDVVKAICERSKGKARLLVNDELWEDFTPFKTLYYLDYPLYILLMLLLILDVIQRRLGLQFKLFQKKAVKNQPQEDAPVEKDKSVSIDDEFYLSKLKKKK